jgi:hypothetical protein
MNSTSWIRIVGAALLLAGWALPGWGAGTAAFSGTVTAVDRAGSVIELGEIGPWRVKEGKTEITRRQIAVSASTEFARVKRAADGAPSGWIGDFVESRLPAWDVKVGDFVTVTVAREGERLTAVKIMVVEPSGP